MIRIEDQIIERGNFPDGTLLIKYAPKEKVSRIYWKFENNEELIILYDVVRHLQEKGYDELELFMPYIPNARQDRVKNEEDIFTLRYFCELINALHFKKVYVLDPHSDVSCALLHHIAYLPIKPYVEQVIQKIGLDVQKDIIFYPDSGSQKRYQALIPFQNAFGIKQRDWETGEIKGLEVSGCIPAPGFTALIVDDISSFGGTFYFSARKLKALGAGKIYLYVTHCEDSILQGKLLKEDIIEHIFTTDSLLTARHEKISVMPVQLENRQVK